MKLEAIKVGVCIVHRPLGRRLPLSPILGLHSSAVARMTSMESECIGKLKFHVDFC